MSRYWYWYWRSDSPGIGIGIGIEILHITGIGIGIGFENLVLSGSGVYCTVVQDGGMQMDVRIQLKPLGQMCFDIYVLVLAGNYSNL